MGAAAAIAAGVIAVPLMLEMRLARSEQPLDDSWKGLPVMRRGSTLLGVSFRPRQAEAFGLDVGETLERLLAYPIDLIRIGAYWTRIELRPGQFDTSELDWQIDAAERAGKQIILSVGPIKNFGYPEFFVPAHHLPVPIAEGTLVRPTTHGALLGAATDFIRDIVTRYRNRKSVVAWQLEHEALDPLGMEHSWRLGVDFLEQELATLRAADATRPIVMNGFLPTSSMVRVTQWWRTRDQGDSRASAARFADIVGVDYYPRHALLSVGKQTVYLDGSGRRWQLALTTRFIKQAQSSGKRVMISEGQAEPWEAVTRPPNPAGRAMFSCRPHDLIRNYNDAMAWSTDSAPFYGYLFWGAEYWILRDRSGDPSYLHAFSRILDEA
jgi:hypothetical protein